GRRERQHGAELLGQARHAAIPELAACRGAHIDAVLDGRELALLALGGAEHGGHDRWRRGPPSRRPARGSASGGPPDGRRESPDAALTSRGRLLYCECRRSGRGGGTGSSLALPDGEKGAEYDCSFHLDLACDSSRTGDSGGPSMRRARARSPTAAPK